MGRHRKTIQATEEDYEWPFKISIRIRRSRPKIAFMSGCPRDFYPDDPGFSRFGIAYCLPDPDDTTTCKYVPSDDRLTKPVSTLGYGIGGLSGPRFAKDVGLDVPAPNAYQEALVPPPVKKKEKIKKASWREFVEKYEKNESGQMSRAGAGNTGLPSSTAPQRTVKQEKVPLCPRKIAAFGMCLNNPRFPKRDLFQNPGAGTYESIIIADKESFHITNPQGELIPRVRMVCMPGGSDTCMTCGKELEYGDYYQTKNKFKIVDKLNHADNFKLNYLSMCRVCYCKALQKGYPPWSKQKVKDIFMKARHCSVIHDHREGHDEFLTKATCKAMFRLSRKELLYSKYFKDSPCHKAI